MSASLKPRRRSGPGLRIEAKAAGPAALGLTHADVSPDLPPGWCLVEVAAAGVNPSDVKALMGVMPKAVFPRTPGRDFAGSVVEGPAEMIGREVWGSGGDVGISRDGSHASLLALPPDAIFAKPRNLSMREAAATGVPFVTAEVGFREAGGVRAGQVVLVLGANGRVGQAACRIARAAGARVFAGVRRPGLSVEGAEAVLDSETGDVAAAVRAATGGHGADLVFNCVGSPWFAAGNAAMAHGATQVFIATLDRAVPFDIFAFYRGQHRYVGVDTLALSAAETGAVLEALRPGFESGALTPYEIEPDFVFPLARAEEAYRIVLGGAPQRVLLEMGA
ncbi:zinc-binding alcohol dehydrogenase family protein [Roseomonas nepalensis]|uniref:Zinc-binding alcohol dehydrogenase family protein n=1 Tax=Muricoccus nepalensis TaxID=1854500 RepID=A0A502FSJ3_9PROT|nr:zinc-binding alcohol dehydrogenase family protein [Roseomonas nepalensis]TPG52391.1 zinc-binding alcohol dehydrogenase family protein [Roseomonas nepalensis]